MKTKNGVTFRGTFYQYGTPEYNKLLTELSEYRKYAPEQKLGISKN